MTIKDLLDTKFKIDKYGGYERYETSINNEDYVILKNIEKDRILLYGKYCSIVYLYGKYPSSVSKDFLEKL